MKKLADELFEPVADSHGTRASADAGPDFPEEAWG